jgi:hypothetical protein
MKKNYKYTILYITLMLLIIVSISSCTVDKTITFQPKPGDLLFQDGVKNSFTNAIEKVTTGYNGANFSHIGIVAKDNAGKLVVIEAKDKVQITPISKFLSRSLDKNESPKVIVGRLLPKYQYLIPQALAFAYKQVNKPYNNIFDLNNTNAYYCSQLVYESFKEANGGKPLFKLYPMTFISPDTSKTSIVWKKYFKKLNSPVPEGEPGCNPGQISKSKKIKIIHAYGIPTGWTKRVNAE